MRNAWYICSNRGHKFDADSYQFDAGEFCPHAECKHSSSSLNLVSKNFNDHVTINWDNFGKMASLLEE